MASIVSFKLQNDRNVKERMYINLCMVDPEILFIIISLTSYS